MLKNLILLSFVGLSTIFIVPDASAQIEVDDILPGEIDHPSYRFNEDEIWEVVDRARRVISCVQLEQSLIHRCHANVCPDSDQGCLDSFIALSSGWHLRHFSQPRGG